LELRPLAEGRAAVSHLFDLGKLGLNEGDRVSYRLRVADNRQVPEAKLFPQQSYFPLDGAWSDLKVERDAAPLKQQQIASQRDAIEERLRQVADSLSKQQKSLRALRLDSSQRDMLRLQEAERLEEIRGRVLESSETLDDLARDAGITGDLAGLADAVREAVE